MPMGRIIRPPVEEARRLYEGKIRTKDVDVGISFIKHGYSTDRDGRVHIRDLNPPLVRRCYWKGEP